ncbi:uncharacterized protein B0H18DRAFT_879937 [Fomitopsis serialis]|uniref:uncharacterized protein n=1 Tax=Fomitopsis serialis TaxID=139415 RepID=UPI0020074AF0|nr:uncharacterized protein B0H18DRAFT_879937 [Neoantrodia serialis]KAH9921793.1 hypothetical protein B0H18DRAFT_879937 [Neoantrodia serialis]
MSASRRRSLFRPCIDLHNGQVKQIVGGTLSENDPSTLRTNFRSSHPSAYYAELYKTHGLEGGHVIKLGPGNNDAAREALRAWEGHLQVGGGIDDTDCREWLEAGASKVIVTSHLFPDGRFSLERLQRISSLTGKERLVVDVSCRRVWDRWFVATNKWQMITDMEVRREQCLRRDPTIFTVNSGTCRDVEGLCEGIDESLYQYVRIQPRLALSVGFRTRHRRLATVDRLSNGRVDLTYGR